MTRIATVMYVNEDSYDAYKRRHDELWPEMKQLLKESGVHDYSIFLNEATGELFAVLDANDKTAYDNMAHIMQVNEDNSPKSTVLREMFYLK